MRNARFRGRFEIKMDPKGRISLPSAFRAGVGERRPRLVVTNSRYQDKSCLHAYASSDWLALEARVALLPALKPEVQAFQRFYLSGGQEVEIDGQGRILVPQSLRKFASLEETATLVGLGDKFEIWPTPAWTDVHRSLSSSFEDTLLAIARLDARGAASPPEPT